jgi:hypothetical protein
MADTITLQGLMFERDVAVGGARGDGVYYEHADPGTGITWTAFRPACPEYCTPYWTCHVTQGARIRSLTACVAHPNGTVDVGPLCHDVPHGDEDPPMQLLSAVADMIHQGIDPFGPGTTPWTDPQVPCLVDLDAPVAWNRRTWRVAGREWRGRWLLRLVWPVSGGIVRDVPVHQVAPVTGSAGEQLRLM